jgi:hypothetical protein
LELRQIDDGSRKYFELEPTGSDPIPQKFDVAVIQDTNCNIRAQNADVCTEAMPEKLIARLEAELSQELQAEPSFELAPDPKIEPMRQNGNMIEVIDVDTFVLRLLSFSTAGPQDTTQ